VLEVDDGTALEVEPFVIDVAAAVLEDLRARVRGTRVAPAVPGEPWRLGTDRDALVDLLEHWGGAYDWRAHESELNEVHHHRATIDGLAVHFVHERAPDGNGIPIVLGHGWPSSIVELLPLVPLLTNPSANGIDGPAFDVVIPSLPGYLFSERAARPTTYRDTAATWHRLMRGLGYARYGAGGGDFGAGVATFMALDGPEPLLGLHLTNLELAPYTGPGSRPLTGAERDFLAQSERWQAEEGGYTAIQSTKPQTLGYALHDSPAGLAAWILEKWHSWSDSGGDVMSPSLRELVLTTTTLFWVSGCITSSMLDYSDNRRWQGEPHLGADQLVRVPTAVAVFPHMLVTEGEAPREWAERLYDVRRWTRMPRGGHFAPSEEPELVARDIVAFFAEVTRGAV
jgi:pimeloyl-ACP methyl ester carboxylesterase